MSHFTVDCRFGAYNPRYVIDEHGHVWRNYGGKWRIVNRENVQSVWTACGIAMAYTLSSQIIFVEQGVGVFPFTTKISQICAASSHAYLTDWSGTLYGWGRNTYGQLGRQLPWYVKSPAPIRNITRILLMATTDITGLFVCDGDRNIQCLGDYHSASHIAIPNVTTLITNGLFALIESNGLWYYYHDYNVGFGRADFVPLTFFNDNVVGCGFFKNHLIYVVCNSDGFHSIHTCHLECTRFKKCRDLGLWGKLRVLKMTVTRAGVTFLMDNNGVYVLCENSNELKGIETAPFRIGAFCGLPLVRIRAWSIHTHRSLPAIIRQRIMTWVFIARRHHIPRDMIYMVTAMLI